MEALKTMPYIFLILCVGAIIAGASSLTISNMGSTMTQCADAANGAVYAPTTTGARYNSTIQTGVNLYACVNGTYNVLQGNTTLAYRTTLYTLEGQSTVAQQFPTIGIIAVMVIIISLIAGVMGYMTYFR